MNISEWLEAGKPWNVILHGDCMDLMKHFKDNEIQLCIVDPPYGIGAEKGTGDYNKKIQKIYNKKWDTTPDKKYFDELFRISQNQIICGGNYFLLPTCRCFIIWYKTDEIKGRDFSECEYLWTSFKKPARLFSEKPFMRNGTRIHPTQKPVALYRWLLQNYAKPGDKIIDTHSGSGSLACACHLEKFDFLAIEKDADYHKSSCERLETLRSQGMLF
jgi:site-specific DNA-methyltransferase (adenine-specific)